MGSKSPFLLSILKLYISSEFSLAIRQNLPDLLIAKFLGVFPNVEKCLSKIKVPSLLMINLAIVSWPLLDPYKYFRSLEKCKSSIFRRKNHGRLKKWKSYVFLHIWFFGAKVLRFWTFSMSETVKMSSVFWLFIRRKKVKMLRVFGHFRFWRFAVFRVHPFRRNIWIFDE